MTINANTNATNATTENFYNFTADCVAYINDIRVVKPQNKPKSSFVSVKIAILEGEKDEPNKVFADLIVRGEQAQKIIAFYKDYWPKFGQENSWFASLRIGSMYPKTYTNKKTGEVVPTMGGRLLTFTYLKIGDTVIELPKEDAKPQAAPQAQQPAPQPQAAPQAQQPAPQPMLA